MLLFLELIAAFQTVPPHEVSTISIVAVLGLATIGIQIHFGSTTRSRIEGAVSEKINGLETRVGSLEESKSKLWEHVNEHSKDIVKLQTQQEMKRTHHA